MFRVGLLIAAAVGLILFAGWRSQQQLNQTRDQAYTTGVIIGQGGDLNTADKLIGRCPPQSNAPWVRSNQLADGRTVEVACFKDGAGGAHPTANGKWTLFKRTTKNGVVGPWRFIWSLWD